MDPEGYMAPPVKLLGNANYSSFMQITTFVEADSSNSIVFFCSFRRSSILHQGIVWLKPGCQKLVKPPMFI